MSADTTRKPTPRLVVTREEAAEALGLSVDSFDRHVRPEIRVLRTGRRLGIPVSELQKWIDRNSVRAGGGLV